MYAMPVGSYYSAYGAGGGRRVVSEPQQLVGGSNEWAGAGTTSTRRKPVRAGSGEGGRERDRDRERDRRDR